MKLIISILRFLGIFLGVTIVAPIVGLVAGVLVLFVLAYFGASNSWSLGTGIVVGYLAWLFSRTFFAMMDEDVLDEGNKQDPSSAPASTMPTMPTAPDLPRPAGTFKFFCPCCGNRIESPHAQIGTRASCPHCSGQIVVPNSTSA